MAGPVSERRLALFAKFRGIATERVQRLLESMPRLCASTVAQPDVIESLRELHTLKGEARMLSLVALNEVAHATEDILVVLKGRDQGLSAYERKLFSQGLDLCGDLLRLEDFGPGPYDVEVKRYLAQAKAPAPPDTSGDDHVAPAEAKTTPSAELTPPASSQKREVTVATTPPIVATEPRAISALRLETARVSVTALEDATETVGTLLLRHDEMGEYAQDIGRLHRDLSELFAGLRVRSLARRHDGEDGLAQVVERGTALLREMNVSLTRLSDGFFDHRSRILDLQDATRTMR
ncbi:MAG: Hpt domain-containing protein, partial [Candidatus Limnocylindrus sp.]